MNDNDIIKTLECCTRKGGCVGCPLYKLEFAGTCVKSVLINSLNLINRLKAEIERLNHVRAELSKEIDRLKAEMSYMKSPNTIGDTHEMGAW